MQPPPPSYEAAAHYPSLTNLPPISTTAAPSAYNRPATMHSAAPHYPAAVPGYSPMAAHAQPPPHLTQQQQPQQPKRERPTQEIRAYEDARDRRHLENLSDLYAIIKATEHLEIAYGRDAISPDEYSDACSRLISQFRSTEAALRQGGDITSAEEFVQQYGVDCPRAYERLLRTGAPATVLHMVKDDRGESVLVAETVQNFITAMDAIKLEQRAVDELHPLISDLMTALNRVPALPLDFITSTKLKDWLVTLNSMRAVEELSEEQARELAFVLDSSYSAFHRFLQDKSRK